MVTCRGGRWQGRATDDPDLTFFSTVTTLGAPRDIALQELRIECFFPADDATERRTRRSY
jgi:hypothetical protein